MSRQGVLDAIATILGAVTTPTFAAVLRAEPLALAADPAVAFWYEGDRTEFNTLSDANVHEAFTIRAYWRLPPSGQLREGLELEIWNANRAIKAGLRADSQLGGNCTDLKVDEDSETAFSEIGGGTYRVLSVPLKVWMYEVESIAP